MSTNQNNPPQQEQQQPCLHINGREATEKELAHAHGRNRKLEEEHSPSGLKNGEKKPSYPKRLLQKQKN